MNCDITGVMIVLVTVDVCARGMLGICDACGVTASGDDEVDGDDDTDELLGVSEELRNCCCSCISIKRAASSRVSKLIMFRITGVEGGFEAY